MIITVASAAGRIPGARAPIPYGAAKAAIALLTRDVAAQAGPYGIRANCIAPETILTERNRQLIPAAQQANLAGFHPLQRLGTPADTMTAGQLTYDLRVDHRRGPRYRRRIRHDLTRP